VNGQNPENARGKHRLPNWVRNRTGQDTLPQPVLCLNPTQGLTCWFTSALVLIRLVYAFVVRVFGWLA